MMKILIETLLKRRASPGSFAGTYCQIIRFTRIFRRGFGHIVSCLLLAAIVLFTIQPCFTETKRNPASKILHPIINIHDNPFRYSDYYHDGESDLYYLNARYYSPELMRFISRDTFDVSNRYTYCDDNPIFYTDPTGHHKIKWKDCIQPVVSMIGGIMEMAFSGGSLPLIFGGLSFYLSGWTEIGVLSTNGKLSEHLYELTAGLSAAGGLFSVAAGQEIMEKIGNNEAAKWQQATQLREQTIEKLTAEGHVRKQTLRWLDWNGSQKETQIIPLRTIKKIPSADEIIPRDRPISWQEDVIAANPNNPTDGITDVLNAYYAHMGIGVVFNPLRPIGNIPATWVIFQDDYVPSWPEIIGRFLAGH